MTLQELEEQVARKFEIFFMMQTIQLIAGKGNVENMVTDANEAAKEVIELFNKLDDGTITTLKSVH